MTCESCADGEPCHQRATKTVLRAKYGGGPMAWHACDEHAAEAKAYGAAIEDEESSDE